MAARATWKGHLKLSLVSCPVRLFNVTSRSGRISFHLLHKDTKNRIRMRPHDPELGEVDRADLVKGYEFEKDRYVVLDDDDFRKVQIESTHTMEIERFVEEKDVDPLYLDSPYVLAPDGPVAEETFTVLREAMRKKKKVALSRLVLSSREHLVAISPRDKGFLVTTLRTADEVRDPKSFFEDMRDEKPDQEMLDLAAQLIEKKEGPFDPKEFRDRYEDALLDVIKAKVQGEEPVVAKAPERAKVINLMDALKQSLEGGEGKKPPAKSHGRRGKAAASGGGGKKSSGRKKRAGGKNS